MGKLLWLTLLICGLAAPAYAEAPPDDPPAITGAPLVEPSENTEPGFLRGEKFRYQNMNVVLRTLADIPALPTAVLDWTLTEWAVAGGVLASSGALMLPLDPSPDVRIDQEITEHFDPWFPDVWATPFQAPFWVVVAAGSGSTWGFAMLFDEDEIAESMSLAGESVAAFQFYHLTLKVAFGRDEDGKFYGPPRALQIFPKGTPGGHFGTLYALYGALETYWQPPLSVRVGMHTLLAAGALTHVLNHRHFISDQILGASMGYATSKWVVHHRSSRFQYDQEADPVRIAIVPFGRGLALRVVH